MEKHLKLRINRRYESKLVRFRDELEFKRQQIKTIKEIPVFTGIMFNRKKIPAFAGM